MNPSENGLMTIPPRTGFIKSQFDHDTMKQSTRTQVNWISLVNYIIHIYIYTYNYVYIILHIYIYIVHYIAIDYGY